MSIPASLLVHVATVEGYVGSGAGGDTYASPVALPCYFEQQRTVVKDANGDDAVSEATVYADLGDDIAPGSRVSVNGYESSVITVSIFDDAGITGLAHRELALA